MQCPRCHNKDEKYFYKDGKQIYCRKCIQFGRVDVDQTLLPRVLPSKRHHIKAHLNFELTEAQEKVSAQLCEHALNGKDTLVYACCGAGKTEICFEVITSFINASKTVGFAISRRQVVLEITQRLKKAYPRLKVVAVCQGYTAIDEGDLIVCTMHQLYRYHQSFDLLIMDEVDAFPYKDNEVLETVAQNACKGVVVYLTATPTEKMLEDVKKDQLKQVELFTRPHGHPLVEPKCCVLPRLLCLMDAIYTLIRIPEQWLVFVPTIEMANRYSKFFSVFLKCASFTSQTENKEEILDAFSHQHLRILFTSTILERGVTFKGIHVLVLDSDHPVFDEASLIQIVGRVGRDPKKPGGIAKLYMSEKSHDVKRCVYAIKKMNETLSDMF